MPPTLLFPVPLPAPTVSCFALSADEYLRREDAATALEEALQVRYDRPDGSYGREILWHPAFPAECVALLGRMPLFEIVAWLQTGYANNRADDAPLDFFDYAYLADVLREGLATGPVPLAALRLARALAWVEQAGAALQPVAPPAAALVRLPAPRPTAAGAPALVA